MSRHRHHRLPVVAHLSGDATRIEPRGELDLASAAAVEQVANLAMSAGASRLVLDLRRLSFIDSSGIWATVAVTQRAAARDLPLTILPGPPPVQWAFELCGLTEQLPFD